MKRSIVSLTLGATIVLSQYASLSASRAASATPLAIAKSVTLVPDNTGYALDAIVTVNRLCDTAQFGPPMHVDAKSRPVHNLLLIVSSAPCAEQLKTYKVPAQHFRMSKLPESVVVLSGPAQKPKTWVLPIIIQSK